MIFNESEVHLLNKILDWIDQIPKKENNENTSDKEDKEE